MLLVPLLLACSSDETAPDAQAASPEAVVVIPVMTVSSPERGSFTSGGSAQLTGQVEAGTYALEALTLNGAALSMTSDGAFDVPLGLEPGINILGLRVEDAEGERAVDGRAIYAGPLHEPGADLPGAVRMHLGPSLLDDDEDDLDDIAGIAAYIFAESDVAGALVGVPVETDYATITPTSVSFGDISVDLTPADGALIAAITLRDLWMDFEADSWVFSTTGSIWADAVVLETSLQSVGGTGLIATGTVVDMQGYGGEIDWFPDALLEWAEGYLEEEIAAATEELVSALLGDYLSAFSVDAELLDGVAVRVSLSEVDVGEDGLRLSLDAAAEATSAAIALPESAGSAATEGDPPDWPISEQPFSLAVDDDLVNQLLFATWAAGVLSDYTYGSTELIVLTGSEPVPPLGPVDTVRLGMSLPPMLGAATEDDMSADVLLGEWRMVFERTDGEELSFSINVRAGAALGFNDADEMTLTMDNRPALITMEVGVLSYPDNLDPGDLAALIKLLVPPLLGNADNFLPGVTLPPLDLGLLSESLDGVLLSPASLSLSVDDGGWVVLDGTMAGAAE